METPQGARQTQGQWPLPGLPRAGPTVLPTGSGRAQEGLAQDKVIRTLGAEGERVGVHLGMYVSTERPRTRSPALSPLHLSEPRFPGLCPSWRLGCTQIKLAKAIALSTVNMGGGGAAAPE